jgi:hypothetical protein
MDGVSTQVTINVPEDRELLRFGFETAASQVLGGIDINLSGDLHEDVAELDSMIGLLSQLRDALPQLLSDAPQFTASRAALLTVAQELIDSGQARMDHADNDEDRDGGYKTREAGRAILAQLGEPVDA